MLLCLLSPELFFQRLADFTLNEGLIFNLQVPPAGICTDNLLTLPSLNVSTWLNTLKHKVLSVNTAQCVQACMQLHIHPLVCGHDRQ